MKENNMATATNEYRPDYVVPPGWVLEERLAAHGISHAEFARRCGRSSKLISEIIAGKAALEPETALQFEKVLGVDASIWLGIETDYQLHQARETELADASAFLEWFKSFPIQDLVARKAIAKPESPLDAASKLLSFFRVASVDAWKMKYGSANVAYRHSASFHSDERALATWLRLGEVEAEQQKAAEFNEAKFKHALRELRLLTRVPVGEALVRAKQLCNQAGVALALIKPLPKTALSGAAWWRSPKEAVIQLSARHKTDDHLWFSLFHEAAHILLHSKKSVFVDETAGDGADHEREADAWASNMLVPQPRWERFIATCPRSEQHVRGFANEQGIAPGIVVGMLQHQGVLPWTHLNGLKKKLVWSDPS
jgi:HTH-type transcriptional regulator / antitoxin HigA